MKGLGDMMKQAQQMQEKMQEIQAQLAEMEVHAEAGAGLVKVIMTGRRDVKSVTIDPSLMQEDKSLLEDLIAAAMNDAARKVEANQQETMADLTAGMPIPPGFKMPF